jgi:EAL domain-containing protein (putative c-di-GMP-specific phosphodiesterase class I)
LAETGLPPQYLEIEITESGMMRNVEKSMDTLRRLKELGIILSIDDFGTGYSSLSHLKRLPLDTLKIDKGFIHDIPTDHENASIVAAVISLAHALKLKVVAEGVETEAEYTVLRGMCCDEIQGYYRGRPVAQEAFAALYLQPGDGEAPAVEHRAHCRDGNVISA